MDRSKPKTALTNIGTSKVFYSLLNGKTTLTEIAEQLKISRPSVIEQLHRLEKVKLVKLGTKEGRYQHYEVDKEGLANLFLNEPTYDLSQIMKFSATETLKEQLSPEYWKFFTEGKELTTKEMFSRFTSRLKENRLWVNYLLDYLKYYASPAVISLVTPVLETVRNFEDGVRVECFRILGKCDPEIWNQLDNSKKELLTLLHIWSIFLRKVRPLNEAAHNSALREMVGYEIMNKTEER